VSLGLDLVHYLVSTITWGVFHRQHEKRLRKLSDDPEITAPPILNWPANILFWLKQGALLWAWIGILRYLFALWQSP
jgi:hypothetical protein